MSARPMSRSPRDLSPEDRARLGEALQRLREATANYDRFIARELRPEDDVPTFPLADVRSAQQEVEQAEVELWRLREDLLGWSRPSWAPSATMVADWFSEEDAAYDRLATGDGD